MSDRGDRMNMSSRWSLTSFSIMIKKGFGNEWKILISSVINLFKVAPSGPTNICPDALKAWRYAKAVSLHISGDARPGRGEKAERWGRLPGGNRSARRLWLLLQSGRQPKCLTRFSPFFLPTLTTRSEGDWELRSANCGTRPGPYLSDCFPRWLFFLLRHSVKLIWESRES